MIIVQAEQQQGSSLYTPYYVILNGGHAPRLIFTLLFIPRVTKRNSLRQTRLAQTGSLLSEPFHLRRANNLLRFPIAFFSFLNTPSTARVFQTNYIGVYKRAESNNSNAFTYSPFGRNFLCENLYTLFG
jgi:hypothetical protein